MRGRARKWDHLHPETARSPITLSDYVSGLDRVLMVKHKSITPEFKEWAEKQIEKRRGR